MTVVVGFGDEEDSCNQTEACHDSVDSKGPYPRLCRGYKGGKERTKVRTYRVESVIENCVHSFGKMPYSK